MSKNLSDYAQQDLSVATQRPRILDMQGFKVIQTQVYLQLLLSTFEKDYWPSYVD
jgi:hypothetical protein